MKRTVSLLLAFVLLLTTFSGVCFAATADCSYTVNGVTKEGTLSTAVSAVKSAGGTIKLLKNVTYTGASYAIKTDVPFTLDLNGHTLTSKGYGIGVGSSAVGVVGTAMNGTTVIKNGTLIAEKQNVLTFQGGLVMQNVTAWSNAAQNIAFYDATGNHNATNLIEGCTFANPAWGPFSFNNKISQKKTKVTFRESTLANLLAGSTSVFVMQTAAEGAQVVLGEGMRLMLYYPSGRKLAADGIVCTGENPVQEYGQYTMTFHNKVFNGLFLFVTAGAPYTESYTDPGAATPPSTEPENPANLTLPALTEIADTVPNRYQALKETAFAYYRKNPYIQYDYTAMSTLGRYEGIRPGLDFNNTPEYASADRTVFNVCTAYVYHCLFHAFGMRLMGGIGGTDITLLPDGINLDGTPIDACIFTYTNDPANPAENDRQAAFVRSILQPGDVVSYRRIGNNSGHTVIWLGEDVTGDGTPDIINVDGAYAGNYEENGGYIDIWEVDGGVQINAAHLSGGLYNSGEYFLFDKASSQYLGGKVNYEKAIDYYSIVRVTDLIAEYPLPARAKTRVKFPQMDIYFTGDKGIYGAVDVDGTVTYTLKIVNNSNAPYTGVEVQLPTPENSIITNYPVGASLTDGVLRQTLNVPAKSEHILTYTVRPTGRPGDVIFNHGGFVHALPLPEIKTAIQSNAPTAAAVSAAANANKSKTDAEFLNGMLETLGVELELPALKELPGILFRQETINSKTVNTPRARKDVDAQYRALYDMLIPHFVGGMYFHEGPHSQRVKKLRAQDLQAGDILLWQENAGDNFKIAVHNGTQFLILEDGQLITKSQTTLVASPDNYKNSWWVQKQSVEQEYLDHFLQYHFFFALRPGQLDTDLEDGVKIFDANGAAAETLPAGDFSVTVSTKWGYANAANVVAAVYNEQGKPLAIRMLPVTGNAVSARFTGLTDAKYLKIFGLTTDLAPLSRQ